MRWHPKKRADWAASLAHTKRYEDAGRQTYNAGLENSCRVRWALTRHFDVQFIPSMRGANALTTKQNDKRRYRNRPRMPIEHGEQVLKNLILSDDIVANTA